MSDESAADKQHKATGRRVEHLKKEGQVLRSQDFTGGLVFMVAIVTLIIMSNMFFNRLSTSFVQILNLIKTAQLLDNNYNDVIRICKQCFLMLLPFLLVVFASVFASPLLFGGWNFTFKPVQFNFNKLNPVTNLGKIFSFQIVMNVSKSILRFIVITSVFMYCLYIQRFNIANLMYIETTNQMTMVIHIVKLFIMLMTIGLIIVISIDVAYAYFSFNKKSMMSTQEIKDEMKETEGNMDVKRKLKQLQFQFIKNRLSITIPQANVIIMNPTHYAVAIAYNEAKDHAPKIIAKGKNEIALHIKHIAIMSGIPVYESPELARSLYFSTKKGAQINPGLYVAVAIVLSYIYQLRQYQKGQAPFPRITNDLKIPKELLHE